MFIYFDPRKLKKLKVGFKYFYDLLIPVIANSVPQKINMVVCHF